MSKRVLIVGPNFFYFNRSIERAFRQLGFETRVEAYDNPIHPYRGVNVFRYKLTRDKARLQAASRAAYRPRLEGVYDAFRPDLVFVINGDHVLPATLERFRQGGARVALWLFDSLVRMPICVDNLLQADAVFCYEQEDLRLIGERYGVEARFLPQAVDPTLYYPLGDLQELSPLPWADRDFRYDLVFAGDIYHSQKRQRIIRSVVSHYPSLRMRVWGIYKPWFKNPWAWLVRERRDVFMNGNATARQLNADYNQARIVLNIHHEQQRNGANPKVYEICASGAYQICDRNPYLSQLFRQGEVGLYDDERQLFEQIDRALSSDLSGQAASACRRVLAEHTFEHRMRAVVGHPQLSDLLL